MSINAKEKFINAIVSRIEDYKVISQREITDINDLDNTIKRMDGYGLLGYLNFLRAYVSKINAYEYTYNNGLKDLTSEIEYKINNNKYTSKRIILSMGNGKAIVNLFIDRKKQGIQQFLISSSPNEETIPDSLKNIEVESTCVYVNGECGSVFERYLNLDSKTLILEKYRQNYAMSEFQDSSEDLIRLCGSSNRDLEILYNQEEPIYAQLASDYKVEMAHFDPNSSTDAKRIVAKINEEVDTIIENINLGISESIKENSPVKRLEKK